VLLVPAGCLPTDLVKVAEQPITKGGIVGNTMCGGWCMRLVEGQSELDDIFITTVGFQIGAIGFAFRCSLNPDCELNAPLTPEQRDICVELIQAMCTDHQPLSHRFGCT
jgi:hypothetical protein